MSVSGVKCLGKYDFQFTDYNLTPKRLSRYCSYRISFK